MKNKLIILSLFLYILFYCLDYYFRISPSLIFTQLLHQYHTSALGMGAFASAFYLGYLFMQIPVGILLDRPYYRFVIIASIVLCSLAFIVFIISGQYWLGYLLRWVIGGASAFSFICVLHVTRRHLDPKWFGTISGITIAAGTLTASFLQLGSAFLMQHFTWHHVFISIAASGLVLALLLLLLTSSTPGNMPIENTSQGMSWFKQVRTFSCQPLLLINGAVGGLFYLPTTLFATMWGIPFLKQTYHMSATQGSFGITLLFLGWAIGSPLIGFVMDRVKSYLRISLWCAILATVVSIVIVTGVFKTVSMIWLLLLLFGLFSSAQVIVWKYFSNHCPKAISGYGTAFTNMLILLFAALFHVVVGYFAEGSGSHHALDYQQGLIIMPIAFGAVIVLTIVMIVMQKNKS